MDLPCDIYNEDLSFLHLDRVTGRSLPKPMNLIDTLLSARENIISLNCKTKPGPGMQIGVAVAFERLDDYL